jgi:DNA-binding MarR family transcriptional regulator
VLRFLSRANQFSRTVSAFAEFHATTRGTASQTVKSLVSRGYLSRTKSKRDGRSVIFDLTEAGRAVLSRDPCSALVSAAGELPATTRNQLTKGLERLLGRLVEKTNVRPFGTCGECAFVADRGSRRKGKRRPECELRGESLDESELTQTCVNFCSSDKK